MGQRVMVRFDGDFGRGLKYAAYIDGYDPASRRYHVNYGDTTEWIWADAQRCEAYLGKKCEAYLEGKRQRSTLRSTLISTNSAGRSRNAFSVSDLEVLLSELEVLQIIMTSGFSLFCFVTRFRFLRKGIQQMPPPWEPELYGLDDSFTARSVELEKKREAWLKAKANAAKTKHYCADCDRSFKSGMSLGGHRSRVHSKKRPRNQQKVVAKSSSGEKKDEAKQREGTRSTSAQQAHQDAGALLEPENGPSLFANWKGGTSRSKQVPKKNSKERREGKEVCVCNLCFALQASDVFVQEVTSASSSDSTFEVQSQSITVSGLDIERRYMPLINKACQSAHLSMLSLSTHLLRCSKYE